MEDLQECVGAIGYTPVFTIRSFGFFMGFFCAFCHETLLKMGNGCKY